MTVYTLMADAGFRGYMNASRIGWRLFSLFRDPPSWAEFSSAVGITAYGLSFFLSGRSPEAWSSLNLLTDALPDWWWAFVTMMGGMGQFVGLYTGRRFIRFAAASGAVLWVMFMATFVWAVYPYSPLLVGFTTMITVMNLLVVARHVRDW